MTSICSTTGTVTITDAAQATELAASCTQYDGSIAVGESFVGDLALNGIELITGTLHAENVAELLELSSHTLQTIGELSIQDNESLAGIDLTDLTVAGDIVVSGNGHGATTLDLYKLLNVTHLSIGTCSSVLLSSLEWTGDARFTSNMFDTLSLPALRNVHGGLLVDDNQNLTSISAPVLTEASLPGDATDANFALWIWNNTALKGTIEFPALATIVHSIIINGSFSNFSLPKLDSFTGKLFIESTEDIESTCKYFEALPSSNSAIDASVLSCIYPQQGGSSDRGKTIGGAAGGAVAFLVILVLAAVGFTFWKIRRRGQRSSGNEGMYNRNAGIELADGTQPSRFSGR